MTISVSRDVHLSLRRELSWTNAGIINQQNQELANKSGRNCKHLNFTKFCSMQSIQKIWEGECNVIATLTGLGIEKLAQNWPGLIGPRSDVSELLPFFQQLRTQKRLAGRVPKMATATQRRNISGWHQRHKKNNTREGTQVPLEYQLDITIANRKIFLHALGLKKLKLLLPRLN